MSEQDGVWFWNQGEVQPVEHESDRGLSVAVLTQPAAYRSEVGHDKYGTPSEDAVLVDAVHDIYGVFDGAGGVGSNAAEASDVAAKTIHRYLLQPGGVFETLASPDLKKEDALRLMSIALNHASRQVTELAPGSITTASVVKVVTIDGQRHALIGNVGDSRIFVDPAPEETERLRTLMSEEPHRIDLRYQLVEDQGIGSKIKNWLGDDHGSKRPVVDNEVLLVPLADESRIVICSDGISGDNEDQYLNEVTFIDALNESTPLESAKVFIRDSKKIDDKSVIVIDVLPLNAAVVTPSAETQSNQDKPKTPKNTLLEMLEDGADVDNARNWGQHRLAVARDEYLRREAGRGRRAVQLNGMYKKQGVESAKAEYRNKREQLMAFEIVALQKQGLSDDEILAACSAITLEEERMLADRLMDHRLVATGNYKFANDDANAPIEAVTKKGIGRQLGKFYEWFGRVDDEKNRTKAKLTRGLAMAGAGVVVGGALAPVVGVVGGMGAAAAGGAFIANRVTKAYMRTHIRKRSEDFNDRHAAVRREELLEKLANNATGDAVMLTLIENQSRVEVRRNRRRTAMALGAAAIGGVAAGAVGHMIQTGEISSHFSHQQPSTESTQPSSPAPSETTGPSSEPNPDNGHGNEHPNSGNGHDKHHNQHESNGKVAGFSTEVTVEKGNGWTYEIQDSFAEKGITLDGEQTLDMYDHLNEQFPDMHGNFFTEGKVYEMSDGRTGLVGTGTRTWNPQVLREMQQYYEELEDQEALENKKAA